MVSFEELREVHRKERASPKLVEIQASFWKDVSEYFARKMEKYNELKNNPSKFTDKVLNRFEKEIRNAGRIIRELYTLRERKISRIANAIVATNEEQDIQDMLPEEQKIYDALIMTLKSGREAILTKVLAGEMVGVAKKEGEGTGKKDTQKVSITDGVSSFLGTDLNLYGPYEKGQTAELPLKYAKLLIEKGKAEILKE